MKKNKFENKKLNEVENIKSVSEGLIGNWSLKKALKNTIVIAGVILVVVVWYLGIQRSAKLIKPLQNSTISLVSKTIGEEMTKDEFGNINVLLIGFGWAEHRWGFLTDSMMVASLNPDMGVVTFISIPRDLYVNKDGYVARLNALLPFSMNRQPRDEEESQRFASWAMFLKEKIEDITSLKIPYYVGISFAGFENLIDKFGGVTINVPKPINDLTFPDRETRWYDPLRLQAGIQTLNGYDALRYARSRHSSSDFDRSYRQQQILSALADQVKGSIKITQIKKMEELFAMIKEVVRTNISFKNGLYIGQYKNKIEHFFSFVLTYECSNNYQLMSPWCLLYTPNRADFAGMSVLIPIGANNNNISNYSKVHDFVYLVAHNQWYLIENAKIQVDNAISKDYAYKNRNYREGKADLVATTLRQYGFAIAGIDNSETAAEETTVYTYGKVYPETIKALKLFMDFKLIPLPTDDTLPPEEIEGQPNIKIVLGNDFIDQLKNKTHRLMQ